MTQPDPAQGTCHLAHFEVVITAVDKGEPRRRWNGDAMASAEASKALWDGVDAFKAALRAKGFEVAHSSFGVSGEEITHG